MADNWETRLAPSVAAMPATSNWEDRIKANAPAQSVNPTEDGSTLQVFNPFGSNFDTGVSIGPKVNNFLAGAGKGLTDAARGIAQKIGAYSFADAKESQRLDAPLMSTGAGKWGNGAGSVAAALPLAGIPGVNTMAGALMMGAGSGLAAPATSWGDMAENTGIGSVAGPAGNAVGRGLGAGFGLVKSTLEPFFKGGQQRLADRMLSSFQPDAKTALRNLAADAGEIVPGSLPTAAEAAQTPGIAQLTKQVMQTPGLQAAADLQARGLANNAARVAAVRTVSGDVGQRAFYAADRDTTANQLYGAARAKGFDPAALTPEAQANIAAFQARIPKGIIAQARLNAQLRGTPMTNATSLDGMHWTQQALGDAIGDAQSAGKSTLAASYMGLKSDLLAGMDAMSPDYAAARKTFADMSHPINQMDVGQALSDKLIPALNDFGGNGNLRAAGYAEALRHGDATAQRVLGMPTAAIGDVLGPEHMATLNSLGADLARSSSASSLARASGSDTVQNALSQNIIASTLGPLGLPPALSHSTLLQSLLRPAQWAGSLAEPKVMERLGQTLLSPQETAASLGRAMAPRTQALYKALRNYGGTSGGAAARLLGSPQGAEQ